MMDFLMMDLQVSAAEVTLELDTVMACKPAGSAALRSALMKAEAAASAIGGGGGAAVLPVAKAANSVSDVLMPLIQVI
jgi:hypothetical protein